MPTFQSKIEKVPRYIQGEKSRKDTAILGKPVSTIGAKASPKRFAALLYRIQYSTLNRESIPCSKLEITTSLEKILVSTSRAQMGPGVMSTGNFHGETEVRSV